MVNHWQFIVLQESINSRRSLGREDYREYQRVDWVFHPQSDGYLLTPRGELWGAVSGGHFLDRQRGACPFGWYRIARSAGNRARDAFRDQRGNGWFCPIYYNYTPAELATLRRQGIEPRTQLGIHPDGGSPGTHGCIGITDPDTSRLRNELRTTDFRALKVWFCSDFDRFANEVLTVSMEAN